jgi:hypothetical protein
MLQIDVSHVSTHPLDAGVYLHAANSKAGSFNFACTTSSIVWSSSKAKKGARSLCRATGSWKRNSEEIGDILEARRMQDDELPLLNPIANPVQMHVQ